MEQVKLYNSVWNRDKDENKDINTITPFDELPLSDPNEIIKCRKAYNNPSLWNEAKTENKTYNNLKVKLKSFNVSNFGNWLDDEFISTGLIHYDYDKLSNNQLVYILDILKQSKNIRAYQISPSGVGVKIFFAMTGLTKENFKNVYINFGEKVDSWTKQKHDKQIKDYNRLCFISDEIHFKKDFKTYNASDFSQQPLSNKSVPSKKSIKTNQSSTNQLSNNNKKTQTIPLLEDLVEKLKIKYFSEKMKMDYDEWTELIRSIKFIVENDYETGLKYFIEISKIDSGYISEEKCIQYYSNFTQPKKCLVHIENFYKKHNITMNPDLLLKMKEKLYLWFYDAKTNKLKISSLKIEEIITSTYFRVRVGENKSSTIIYKKEGVFKKYIYDFDSKTNHGYYAAINSLLKEYIEETTDDANMFHYIMGEIKKYYTPEMFQKIDLPIIDMRQYFKKDTEEIQYHHTITGRVKVTKDSVVFEKYNEEDMVEEEWLIWGRANDKKFYIEYNPDLDWNLYKSLDFYKKFADDSKERFESLMSIFGYFLSTHRKTGNNFITILIDGKNAEDNGGGGTGKSIVASNFKHIRKTLRIPTQKYDKFFYSDFDEHNIVYLEDWQWDVEKGGSIQNFRGYMDLSFSYEQKFKNKNSTDVYDTPRLLVSTNFTPDTIGDADKRRVKVFNASNFFGRKRTVEDYLGHMVLSYPDIIDWQYWLAFMIQCSQFYLQNGLICENNEEYLIEKRNTELDENPKYIDLRDFIIDYIRESEQICPDAVIKMNHKMINEKIKNFGKISDEAKNYIKNCVENEGYIYDSFKSTKRDEDRNKHIFTFTKKEIVKSEQKQTVEIKNNYQTSDLNDILKTTDSIFEKAMSMTNGGKNPFDSKNKIN